MCKTCNDCYWLNYRKDCCIVTGGKLEMYTICDDFLEMCECGNMGIYKYNDKVYCKECLIDEFDLDVYTVDQYYSSDGEYLGDSDDDFDSIIKMLSDNIEILED